jgi:CHAT domain-containing protein
LTCDTAQGSLDFSEGLYGLARAFRIAGARDVLVTLWPLNDGEAPDFMKAFYREWLAQTQRDPAAALRAVQSSYIDSDNPARRNPHVWAPYILIQ